jgi:fido (protein-threonine AMPylation protein)
VFKENIATELANLLADVKYWIENKTFGWDEIGARFHHRLVSIHLFVNGNGRHARIMTNILLSSNGQEPFSWGMKTHTGALEVEGALRDEYISALKKADGGNYEPLLRFVRS